MIAAAMKSPQRLLTPDDIVGAVRHLPSAPKILPRLKRLLCDGNSAVHEIVALIRFDSGIVARVLQVSNSVYFGKGARCLTVEEAVSRVGFDQVYELVSYAVASQVLVRPLEVYGLEADELWKISVACALGAETVAEHTGQDPEMSYTIGLLHGVGMVAIDGWALQHARHLKLPTLAFPQEASASERAVLGFTQAEVGGALLREWGFAREMTEPVRWQYAPHGAGSEKRMADLLFAAKWLRSAVCAADPVDWPPLPDAACLQSLDLTPSQLENMVADVVVRLDEVSSLLDTGTSEVNAGGSFPSQEWIRPR
jgi:HD-like signal output (HDOD) protein